MHQPSSRHLSHDYEAYKGLSLRELFWIVVVTTPVISIFFSLAGLFIGYPLACGCVGFIVGFIMSITFCPKRAAAIKAGKPHGYLMKKTVLLMAKWGLRRSPYLHHVGTWQKSKLVG
ncbi:TIGR03750 family conjugal transfer protein [Legionella pneumophila serogroup 1]|uniref:TIGR03750 family conjugal transfer protein n=1 Tax=Legionella pneumophila TaxID=446 RepID=UPI000770B61E|nr:TIGR03750 family conjugal transfer protein [Legionella pneumophila]HAT8862511.1 TIGR03750 family conjugal transfer protein [Legionella pneumophila subsp. pneumophila]MDI9825852.1 TIGR03750 family conjugal transfer protein [Legionella pneumophila]MDW8896980.1 TIGR03750 family conjugal transfer protein [Legionella pneumophila]CZH49977.1 conjugative transfer region protein [Legionella pneumophila]CZI55363.1 conjugative transfer region protein [Legionella pneumophila]